MSLLQSYGHPYSEGGSGGYCCPSGRREGRSRCVIEEVVTN